MSVTIDSLDIQIRSSAGSAAANIDRLADALGKMRANAKLTTVTNNLTKLSEALGKLQGTSTGLSNIRGLAGAMKSLSQVEKASGFNSLVNTLKKLPDIVNQLDASTLSLFTSRMRQLAAALAPLAKEINTVGVAFSKLPARVSQIVTGTNRMAAASRDAAAAQEDLGDSLNATSINLAAAISNLQTFIGVLNVVRDQITAVIADAIEWDGIQFRFGRAFGEDAEEVYEYVMEISDALKINAQQFMQYSSLYGSLLQGFGLSQDKVTTISVGLTELSYDIWAAYNDRYKTLEDASEAVRSAITGEIEPIRNAGIALTEASMQEYLDTIGMATVSIEKLSEAQKAEVRYAVMVESAMKQGIVGTYAREMQTAEGAVRTLTQQMKTLGQALGSLFIPLLQVVVPWISAFVEVLTEAIELVAKFFGIPFFKIQWDTGGVSGGVSDLKEGADAATGSLGDATDAAKKLKQTTMGFDELNVITPDSGSSGSGGSGSGGAGTGDNGWGDGLDLDTLWDESVLASASKQIDELKGKIYAFLDKWKAQIAIISGALGALSVAKLLTGLGNALKLGEGFVGVMGQIQKFASTAIIITLQYSLMTEFLGDFMGEDGTIWDYVKAALIGGGASWILYSMWGPAGLVIGLGVTAVASLSAVIDAGGITDVQSATVALTGLASAAGAVAIAWKKVAPAIAESNIVRVLQGIQAGSPAASSALAFMFPTITKIIGFFRTAATAVASFVGGLTAGPILLVTGIIAAIASVGFFLSKNWDAVTAAVKGFFETNIVPKLESIKDSWDRMKESVSSMLPPEVIQWFKDAGEWIGKIVKKIGEWFEGVEWLKIIGAAFEWIGGILFSVFSGALAGAISAVVGVVDGLIQTFSGVIQVVTGIVEFFTALFTGGNLEKPVQQIADGIVNIFVGLYESTIGVVVDFVEGIIDWFTELWDELVGHSIVPDMVEAIIEWFKELPGKILSVVEDFCADVKQFFVDLWNGIKTWWNTNVAPKFTVAYWKNKFNVIKEAIASKLDEAKKAAADKWAAIKSWFSTTIAPKFTKTYWADKFDTLRAGLKEKLDKAWEAVKSFFSVAEWKKKVTAAIGAIKDNFKLPEFPKIKLSVSWDTNVGPLKKAIYEALGLSGWPNLSWSTYAQGGFPATGQMFIAREAGPELVGNIRGRTAVANNDQIVDAVSQGVYAAVIAAMSASGGRQDQNVNVYLDGKQIYASVKKTEAERGRNLMGNQLGYVY